MREAGLPPAGPLYFWHFPFVPVFPQDQQSRFGKTDVSVLLVNIFKDGDIDHAEFILQGEKNHGPAALGRGPVGGLITIPAAQTLFPGAVCSSCRPLAVRPDQIKGRETIKWLLTAKPQNGVLLQNFSFGRNPALCLGWFLQKGRAAWEKKES